MIPAVVMIQKIFIDKFPVTNFAFEIAIFAMDLMNNAVVILKFAFVGKDSTTLFTFPFERFWSVATFAFLARMHFTSMAKKDVFSSIFFGTLVALPFF